MESAAIRSIVIFVILYCIFLVLMFFISAFVAAINDLTDSDIEDIKEKDEKKALKITPIFENQIGYIHTAAFVIVSCLLLEGLFIQKVSYYLSLNMQKSVQIFVYIIVFLIAAILFSIFGIYVPFRVGKQKKQSISIKFLWIFKLYSFLFRPIVYVSGKIALYISAIFGVSVKEKLEDVTEEDIITMVNDSHEQGDLLASEAAMIQNIFAFGDKEAKDIMIHRKNIVALDGNLSLGEALNIINEEQLSRYPVYLDDLDNIIGILHIKDALNYLEDGRSKKRKIRDIEECSNGVEVINETHNINTLFTTMQQRKEHMVVVADEYGQTCGIITMEDILEEIVGSIRDEHDEEEETIKVIDEQEFIMDGSTPLEDAAEILGINIPDEVETLNGYILIELGRVPNEGEKFEVISQGYIFKIQDVKDKIIQEVKISKMPILEEDISEELD